MKERESNEISLLSGDSFLAVVVPGGDKLTKEMGEILMFFSSAHL